MDSCQKQPEGTMAGSADSDKDTLVRMRTFPLTRSTLRSPSDCASTSCWLVAAMLLVLSDLSRGGASERRRFPPPRV